MSAININDYVYDKDFTCPACEKVFKGTLVRMTKVKYVSSDMDLKANYTPIDPLYYEVLLCQNCGYASPQKLLNNITASAADLVLHKIKPNFKPRTYSRERTVDEAIELFRLALLTSVVKNAPASEQGYICMKLAWLYRIAKNEAAEIEFLDKAIKQFSHAYLNEDFPLCDLDEDTFSYLLAAFYKLTGKAEEGLKWLGKVLSSKTASPKLRDRAVELRAEISKK